MYAPHSSVDGCLGCLLAIVNNTSINIDVQISLCQMEALFPPCLSHATPSAKRLPSTAIPSATLVKPNYWESCGANEHAQKVPAHSPPSCPILGDPMDCSQPGSCPWNVPLEWVTVPSSWRFSQPRAQTQVSHVSCVGRWVLYH